MKRTRMIPQAPWFTQSHSYVLLYRGEGSEEAFIPLPHLAGLCDVPRMRIDEACTAVHAKMAPPPPGRAYRMVNLSDVPSVLQHLKWEPDDVATAAQTFVDALSGGGVAPSPSRRGRLVAHEDEHEEEEEEEDGELQLPRKRGRDEGMPRWAEDLARRIEDAHDRCVQQLLRDYCSSERFEADKRQAVAEEVARLRPKIREELEVSVRQEMREEQELVRRVLAQPK